jgi:hypothetical protein
MFYHITGRNLRPKEAQWVVVHQYTALIAARADLATEGSDHLRRHADLHRLGAQVGQLGWRELY